MPATMGNYHDNMFYTATDDRHFLGDNALDDAKRICIESGDDCWGVYDFGCPNGGGEWGSGSLLDNPYFLCKRDKMDNGRPIYSELGSCVFEKVRVAEYDGNDMGLALRQSAPSAVLMLLGGWVVARAAGHA
jgi:hypothetical protein